MQSRADVFMLCARIKLAYTLNVGASFHIYIIVYSCVFLYEENREQPKCLIQFSNTFVNFHCSEAHNRNL
jgi:hypothetical protein